MCCINDQERRAGSQFLDPDGWFPNHVPNPEDAGAMAAGARAVIRSKVRGSARSRYPCWLFGRLSGPAADASAATRCRRSGSC